MDDGTIRSQVEDGPQLRRAVGPWLLLFFIVGDMIGGGIYALVGEVGGRVGGAIWSAFLVALILAVFTAFAYAELVTKYPRAGGAASYIHRAYGAPFVSFMVAFAVIMSGITSASALALAFGGDYLGEFFSAPPVLVALVFMVVVALINFRGISESVRVNMVFTLIEVFGLLLIVAIGAVALGNGTGDVGRLVQFKSEGGMLGIPLVIVAGAVLSFYALIGFEDSVNLAEETHEPSRTFPKALFGGLILTGIIYLLVTSAASIVVPTGVLAESSGPLLEVVRQGPLGVSTTLFSVIALFAVSNGALINMVMASRLVYGMSDQGVMPSVFAKVHASRRTPWAAIIFTTLIALGLIATGDLGDLASTTVFLLLVVFAFVNATVLVLKRDRVEHDHFHAPSVLPVLGLLVSVGLILQIVLTDQATVLRALLLLALGALLWGVNELVRRRLDRRSATEART